MELKFNIIYLELINLLKSLPQKKIKALRDDLKKEKPSNDKDRLSKLLQKGPVMSDKQYDAFLENRKKIAEWRKS